MAKVSPEEPEKAVAPAKPSVGTWPKSEHILHAVVMYGQPQWLVEHVLLDVPEGEQLSQASVSLRVINFLNHKMEVEN